MTEPVDLAEMARELLRSHDFLWRELDAKNRAALQKALHAALESAHLAGQRLMQERVALVADAYADVNLEAAGDTVLADPILRGDPLTAASVAKSESLTIDGCVHSSMFHAAQNIAAALRALVPKLPGDGVLPERALWQPIETAPDRTVFVGRRGQRLRVTAIYSGGAWRHVESLEPICFAPDVWMPLPPPPELPG